MGSCPYCQSITHPGDTICYSCGRVLADLRSKNFAMEQQFSQGTVETTYKMTNRPTGRGVIQTHTGRSKNIMKRTRNKSRLIVIVVFVAFVFTSPVIQEASLAKFASIKETVLLQAAPFHVYPFETEYAVSKTIEVENRGSEGYLIENLIIPMDVRSVLGSESKFTYTDGTVDSQSDTIQKINRITLTVDGEAFDIPLEGLPVRTIEDKLTTSQGHELWWPGFGDGNDYCGVGTCLKVKINLAPSETSSFTYTVGLTSTAHSWWDSSRVDSRITGIEDGINMGNSGSFGDISERDASGDAQSYRGDKWYNRGVSPVMDSRSLGGWAVNAVDDEVTQVANQISQNLPEGEGENAYGYARAAFDYLHEHAVYDKAAPIIARSGPECLAAGTGDCDEQTNAFLSILRVKDMPGWYAFGALTSSSFVEWEAHAWAYIQLPLSDSYCDANNIAHDTCYVQGQVDVVNNKWLLHTPTAYISWIEEPDSSGDLLNAYYRPGLYTSGIDRSPPLYVTTGDHDSTRVMFKVPKAEENLGWSS